MLALCLGLRTAGLRAGVLRSSCLLPPRIAAPGTRAATSKAGGSTRNGRDSNPKYLGVKKFGGEAVKPGDIIVRQRGQRYGIVKSTKTVAFGRDFTIYALKPGFVKFWYHGVKRKNFVEVVLAPPAPGSAQAAAAAPGVPGHRRHPAPLPAEHKYPIVRVRPWELPGLLALPPDTPISDNVLTQLLAHVRSLNPFQRSALLRGSGGGARSLIGGLDRLLAADAAEARTARQAATAGTAPPASATSAPPLPSGLPVPEAELR